MGQFNLIVQYPKRQEPVHGVLTMDKHGVAQFFTGNADADSRVVATLDRARVEHASSSGILISGVERVGKQLFLQEWWLVFCIENAADIERLNAGLAESLRLAREDFELRATQRNERDRLRSIVACVRHCAANGGSCVEIDDPEHKTHEPCDADNCKFILA